MLLTLPDPVAPVSVMDPLAVEPIDADPVVAVRVIDPEAVLPTLPVPVAPVRTIAPVADPETATVALALRVIDPDPPSLTVPVATAVRVMPPLAVPTACWICPNQLRRLTKPGNPLPKRAKGLPRQC